VPVDGEDGGAYGLLEVLGDPPVVLLVERADGDDPVKLKERKEAMKSETEKGVSVLSSSWLRVDPHPITSHYPSSLSVFELRQESKREESETNLAPEATANLSSLGLHLTIVAARLILSRTRVGFHLDSSIEYVQT
jgi:hypothetical protein